MSPPFRVESHYKLKFKDEANDDEWLGEVGRRGWVVLSHDAKFHAETPALEAIQQFNIGCFYLWGAQVPVWDKVSLLTRAFPRIKKIVTSEKRPYIYRVNQRGSIHLVRHWDGRQQPQKYLKTSRQLQKAGA